MITSIKHFLSTVDCKIKALLNKINRITNSRGTVPRSVGMTLHIFMQNLRCFGALGTVISLTGKAVLVYRASWLVYRARWLVNRAR